jgi:glycosyltransferase involved in cell wall biosynthesis
MGDQVRARLADYDRRAVRAKTIVIVTNEFPYEGPAGNLRYIYSIVRFLEQRGHRVCIVLRGSKAPFILSDLRPYFPSGRVSVHAQGMLRLGRWYLVFQPVRVAKNLASKFLSLFPAEFVSSVRRNIFSLLRGPTIDQDRETGAPLFIDTSRQLTTNDQLRLATEVFAISQPEVVFFDTVSCDAYCPLLGDDVTKYVITHDVLHERHQTFIDQGYKIVPELYTRQEEAQVLNTFDVIVAIQQKEAQSFVTMCPDRDVITIPYSVALTQHNPADEATQRCLFAGTSGLQNVDGLTWFLTHVWPTVINQVPTATLHVYGTVCQEVKVPLTGVFYRGMVPDLGEAYSEAALVVIPLRVGSGLKIKIVEALSHGRACVTTSIGAQGLAQGDCTSFVVADEASTFAASVIHLLQNDGTRREMGAAAHQSCLPYTAKAAFQPLVERGM